MPQTAATNDLVSECASPPNGLRFLWLELTNKCNLSCVHCYAESGPHPSRQDVLTTADYVRLLDEGAGVGCRAVQFIGGEPTLHRGLPDLIRYARAVGYEDIEVYTNATILTDSLLSCFVDHQVNIAASVYADDPSVHDAVTTRDGSHARTLANLKRMLAAGLQIRVGVVAMDANKHRIDETISFLRGLGIQRVRVDHARGVGRGEKITDHSLGLQALCGYCWNGSLCVAPDGGVSPCIMSKAWTVGSVTNTGLADLALSAQLRDIRELIRTEVWDPRQKEACDPGKSPSPETPCPPEEEEIGSPPHGCDPNGPVCSPYPCDPKAPCFPVCHP
jgi:organic radical activating enzyme